ncbi:hypothetical protein BDV28DRAFT_133005 [Aspergillus coremiiformis]|uniref:Uncharacterized protein n=1 Tax=Aspergillus coremiiformis TaxID=138285 RepID=A0A5N6Z760_9EURO|nr:hypothetical protein BDV28DRAFT_133005 [Aspergillus coremiiformis]
MTGLDQSGLMILSLWLSHSSGKWVSMLYLSISVPKRRPHKRTVPSFLFPHLEFMPSRSLGSERVLDAGNRRNCLQDPPIVSPGLERLLSSTDKSDG